MTPRTGHECGGADAAAEADVEADVPALLAALPSYAAPSLPELLQRGRNGSRARLLPVTVILLLAALSVALPITLWALPGDAGGAAIAAPGAAPAGVVRSAAALAWLRPGELPPFQAPFTGTVLTPAGTLDLHEARLTLRVDANPASDGGGDRGEGSNADAVAAPAPAGLRTTCLLQEGTAVLHATNSGAHVVPAGRSVCLEALAAMADHASPDLDSAAANTRRTLAPAAAATRPFSLAQRVVHVQAVQRGTNAPAAGARLRWRWHEGAGSAEGCVEANCPRARRGEPDSATAAHEGVVETDTDGLAGIPIGASTTIVEARFERHGGFAASPWRRVHASAGLDRRQPLRLHACEVRNVHGRVLHASGAPAGCAKILWAEHFSERAVELGTPEAPAAGVNVTVADEHGTFRLAGVGGEQIALQAFVTGPEGNLGDPAPGALDDGREQRAASRVVVLSAGRSQSTELRLMPGAIVSGEVRLPSSRFATTGTVDCLLPVHGDSPLQHELVRRVAIGPLGTFRCEQLPVVDGDVVTIVVRVPGHPPTSESITLLAGKTGIGLIVDEPQRIAGTVLDPQQRPVAATISARPAGRTEVLATAEADTSGAFMLESLPRGVFELEVVPRDPALATHRVGAVPSSPAPSPLAIRVSPTGSIRGVVRGSDGAGVAGIAVHAFAVLLEEPGAHYGRSRHAVTDANGGFELPHLPRGLYRLRWPANPRGVLVATDGAAVELHVR